MHEPIAARGRAEVLGDSAYVRAGTRFADSGDGGFDPGDGASVDDHARTFAGQSKCGGEADAGGGAGDQGGSLRE